MLGTGKVDVEEDAFGGGFLCDVGGNRLGSFVGLVGYGEGAEVGKEGGRCEEGGEGGGGGEVKFEEGVGDVCKLGHEREGGGEIGVFGGTGERL